MYDDAAFESAIAEHQAAMCRLAKAVALLIERRRRSLVAVPRRSPSKLK